MLSEKNCENGGSFKAMIKGWRGDWTAVVEVSDEVRKIDQTGDVCQSVNISETMI